MKRNSIFLATCLFVVLLVYFPGMNTAQDTEAVDGSENGIGKEATLESENIATTTNQNDEIVTGIFSVSIFLT